MLTAENYNNRAMKQRDIDRAHFLKNFQNLVLQFEHIVLFHHTRPDGDCLGASFGLKEILRATYPNKKVYVVGGNPDHLFAFMQMKFDNEINFDFDFGSAMAVILDVGQSARIDSFDKFFKDSRISFGAVVKIDHHDSVPDFHVDLSWDDPTYVSTCGQVMQLADYYSWIVTPRAATFLYLGMLTDSLHFTVAGVIPRTLILGAKALRAGADAAFLNDRMQIRSWDRVTLSSYLIQHAIKTEHVIYGVIDKKAETDFAITPSSAKSLVSTYANIDGFWMWILAVEQEDAFLEVSIRSRHASSRELAIKYGGGGHEFAAGCVIHKSDLQALIHDANVIVASAKKDKSPDELDLDMDERIRDAVVQKNPELIEEAKQVMKEVQEERDAGEYDPEEGKKAFEKGTAEDQTL